MTKFSQKYKVHGVHKKRNVAAGGSSNGNFCANKKSRNNRNGRGGGNSGSHRGNGGDRSGNKKLYYEKATGKPTGRWINGCDVELIFTQGVITMEKIAKLPNIIKEWFTKNKGAKLPRDKSKFPSKKY